jgi:hypothetical protein
VDRIPKNEAMSKRPFQLPQNAQTINKYSGLWEHFLCYPLRCRQVCMVRAPEGSLNFQPIRGSHFSLKSLNSYFS